MKKITLYIILLVSASTMGQEVIDRIEPRVILKEKIISCTEWHDEEKGRTVYYNHQGLLDYYHFPADVTDTSYNLVHGDFGKREFSYDKKGNLIESKMSCFEPTVDSFVVLTFIKSYYKEDRIIKREYFDNPSAKPTVVTYTYAKNLLTEEIKTKADSSLLVSTGERFKVESKMYRYDGSQRLTTVLNFRETRLIDSTTVTYQDNTQTWTTFDPSERIVSTMKVVYDSLRREVERTYPEQQIIRWNYSNTGLLESIEYSNLVTGNIRRTTFTYEKKKRRKIKFRSH